MKSDKFTRRKFRIVHHPTGWCSLTYGGLSVTCDGAHLFDLEYARDAIRYGARESFAYRFDGEPV